MDKNVLTIGGLDPSGCAGIAADLKTFMAWDVHGLAVITAITAQNTHEVTGIYPVQPEAIRAQLQSLVSDIEVHAVKIGLLTDSTILQQVVDLIAEFQLTNIVVDPVLRSTTGFEFANPKLVAAYRDKLFPRSNVITPNIDEASAFTGLEVKDVHSMKNAATLLHKWGPKNVIITGGHLETTAVDLLFDGANHHLFEMPKILPVNARGLGCTFSSIIALHLARNQKLAVAIEAAKKYIAKALVHPFQIGKGRGPLNHHNHGQPD